MLGEAFRQHVLTAGVKRDDQQPLWVFPLGRPWEPPVVTAAAGLLGRPLAEPGALPWPSLLNFVCLKKCYLGHDQLLAFFPPRIAPGRFPQGPTLTFKPRVRRLMKEEYFAKNLYRSEILSKSGLGISGKIKICE